MSSGPLVDVKTKLTQIRQKVGQEQVKVEQTRSRVVQMQADLAVQRKAEVVKLEEDRSKVCAVIRRGRIRGEMCDSPDSEKCSDVASYSNLDCQAICAYFVFHTVQMYFS